MENKKETDQNINKRFINNEIKDVYKTLMLVVAMQTASMMINFNYVRERVSEVTATQMKVADTQVVVMKSQAEVLKYNVQILKQLEQNKN